jgi:predicted RNase H-like HicB family nuclease
VIIQLPVSVQEKGEIYVAECPVFNLSSEGETFKDALKNIKNDIEIFLDNEKAQNEYQDVIKDYSIRDIEIVDVVVNPK